MSFELVLQQRNAKGEPTGRTKSIVCETAGELAEFYNKNQTIRKPKKDKNKECTNTKRH